jgi:hypothetical protein
MGATFRATLEQMHGSTSKATVRSHSVLVDRAVAKGGSDLGPAGGEYLVVDVGPIAITFDSQPIDLAGPAAD